MRITAIILGVVVATGATLALRLPADETLTPQQALERESGSPLLWADLGDALFASGNRGQARQAYDRALRLAPQIPQVWVRAANFHFQIGDPSKGLHSAVQALHIVDAYDDILFSYFDRLVTNPTTVLTDIGTDRRAARAYTEHLIASGNIEAAQTAWRQLPYKDQRLKN